MNVLSYECLVFLCSCTVRLYELPSGRGQVKRLPNFESVEDLKEIDFDNRISSIKILGPCRWIFYDEASYNGEATIYEPGAHVSLGDKDNTFSSLRPLPPQGSISAVVFEYANYRGSMMVLRKRYNRLDRMDFNDKVSSIIVTGGTWTASQHAWNGMEGYTEMFEPGDYPELPEELQGKISLVRQVTNE